MAEGSCCHLTASVWYPNNAIRENTPMTGTENRRWLRVLVLLPAIVLQASLALAQMPPPDDRDDLREFDGVFEIILPPSPALNSECTASLLNRLVQLGPNGTFALGNVPVPVGAFRVRIVC